MATEEKSKKEVESIKSLKKNKQMFFKYLVGLFVVIGFLGGVFWLGFTNGQKNAESQSQVYPVSKTLIENKLAPDKKLDFSLFWKVWDLLKEKYVDKNSLDAQKLIYGAIKGMLAATGDPYSTFFDPEENKAFTEDLEGSFDGIGAELGVKDSILTVVAPLEGSPAEKAGLRAGDKILKIDERATSDMNVYEAVNLIRGKKGTVVKLTIFRAGEEETREIAITRDTIEVKSVTLEFKSDVAYLKINKFGEETAREFDKKVNEIILRGSQGIVLDLRNNPGGFLDRSVSVASRLLPANKTVVIEEDATGNKKTLTTKGGDKLSQLPTVVLINEGSASASEILAGALRDNRSIKLVGKKSFGKGSVQELINLPGKSSVKITVAKWLTPNGEYIMEKGIAPDVEVELTKEDFDNNRDPQLDKALEILQNERAISS